MKAKSMEDDNPVLSKVNSAVLCAMRVWRRSAQILGAVTDGVLLGRLKDIRSTKTAIPGTFEGLQFRPKNYLGHPNEARCH